MNHQHEQPPPCWSPWDEFEVAFRLTSTISSVFMFEYESIPGNAAAILRNKGLILNPAFALVSMNITPYSRPLLSPSSIETCLYHFHTKTHLQINLILAHIKKNKEVHLFCSKKKKRKDVYLLSTRSVLFPTRTMITSPARSVRTSSIHLDVLRNESLLDTS